jgi:hypothetical protein
MAIIDCVLRPTAFHPSKAANSISGSGTTKPRLLRLRSVPVFLSTLLGLTAVACGGDNLTLPGDGEPAQISIVSGDDQTATVGALLDDSLVVRVTDSERRPVARAEVVFLPPAGATVAPNGTVLTDSNGEAWVRYTLSTTAGEQLVEARAKAIVPATSAAITFSVSARPENAVGLEKVAGGDGQMAEVSTVLPESLAVRAVDRFGNGVAGIEVSWEARNGGAVSPSSVSTGPDGRAATERTLGDRPGSYASSASAEDLEGSPVSFSATAIAAPQPSLELATQPSAAAAAGVPLEQQPQLQLRDPLGAPLDREDVRVTVQVATGDGSLGGRTTARSDANGRVSFTDLELRGETGSWTLIFAAEGFTPVTSTAITVRPGPPASDRSSVSVPNGTAGVATNIALHLEDEFGNPVSGASSNVSISVEGVNPASNLPVTELGQGSYSSAYVPVHSGTDVIRVEFNGVPLGGSPFQSTVVPGPADPAHTTAVVTRTGIFVYQIDVVVTVRDAQDNPLGRGGDLVQLMVNGGGPRTARDNGDGTYSDSFGTFDPGPSMVITLNGVPIAGSPYTP